MIVQKNRRTKTIWSFESKVLKDQNCQSIVTQDFDALRIVYEAGSGQRVAQFISDLKSAKAPDRILPVMIDVPTPVRAAVSGSQKNVEVKFGDRRSIGVEGQTADISIRAEQWSQLMQNGAEIYFGYGYTSGVIHNVTGSKADVEFTQSGLIEPGMDVHVPSTRPAPKATDINVKDLESVFKNTIDYFVMPGFTSATEIQNFKKTVSKMTDKQPWFILKVNSRQAYDQLEVLLPEVHGVLISRVELALVMEPAMVPVLTKEVIQQCHDKAKICMVASEMLGSMRTNTTPTRAEVSDVANAVADGADAVVLTEDIPYGPNANKAIDLMAKIIEDFESRQEQRPNWLRQDPIVEEEMDAVAYSAYRTAQRVQAKAIVCLTKEGNTAVKLASFRTRIPIIAVTFSRDVLRKLSLIGGVSGVLLEADPVIDQVLPVVNDLLKRASTLSVGDRIVFVSVTLSSLSRTESNLLTVQTVS